MKIVSTSYVNTSEFSDPEKWLDRISFYTGILEELAKQHDVESIEQINYCGKLNRNNVTYHFLNFRKRKLWFPFALHRYIKKLNPDIVFVNGFIFPLQIMQLKRTLGKKIKIIVLHRAEKPFTGSKSYLQKMADSSVDGYLFSSKEFGKEWIEKGIIRNEQKIYEVIQASSSFSPADNIAAKGSLKINGNPIFLWVGRLDENKDPITVVKAFINFLSYRPDAKLYMIYQAEKLLDEVRSLINNNQDSILLMGKVNHHELELWYNAADFFLSGSHYEGSGIAASEAMSCGCIPILTNIMSFRRMTGPGKCGLLYQAGNESDLLSALLKTKEIDVKQEKEKALKQFETELSFKAIASKIDVIINNLTSVND